MARANQKAKPPAGEFDWQRFRAALKSTLIWGALIFFLYLLRDFFPLIFVTFIFAYIMNSMSEGFRHRLPRHRKSRVVLAVLIFLGIWTAAGWFVVPHIKTQAVQVTAKVKSYIEDLKEREHYLNEGETTISLIVEDLPSSLQTLIGPTLKSEQVGDWINTEVIAKLPKILPSLLQTLVFFVIQTVTIFFLATLFSFLILLDLPHLKTEIQKLRQTMLRDAFDVTAKGIVKLGEIVGKTFQAQAVIAICNTALTAIGLYFFGIDQIAFFSFIVLLFSFIPVAGVFISSVPICLVGLEEGGIQRMLLLIGMITAIHMIETYILNPRIMGAALHMNPVLVLVILTLAGKLFGPWGLLLGVPMCYYIFAWAIWSTGEDEPAPAASGGS